MYSLQLPSIQTKYPATRCDHCLQAMNKAVCFKNERARAKRRVLVFVCHVPFGALFGTSLDRASCTPRGLWMVRARFWPRALRGRAGVGCAMRMLPIDASTWRLGTIQFNFVSYVFVVEWKQRDLSGRKGPLGPETKGVGDLYEK